IHPEIQYKKTTEISRLSHLGTLYDGIETQIDQAFKNVELGYITASSAGWSQVYLITSYYVGINGKVMQVMVRNFKKYLPDHEPLWTCIEVACLARPSVRVGIEAVAHIPN
ncbi:uncharacterized protein TRUGW13939_01529, partial [Talaromyces rugulosus]